jgi:hypothetical protein
MDGDIRGLEEDLSSQFGASLDRATVRRVISESVESYADARIRVYVPILVRRTAKERLRQLAGRAA